MLPSQLSNLFAHWFFEWSRRVPNNLIFFYFTKHFSDTVIEQLRLAADI